MYGLLLEKFSLRGRRLKGKGKGVLENGVLGARETRGARSLLPRAWSRALIPFPFPFERLPRRLGKILVVAETWLDKKDHRFTPVASCPRQKSSDLRPNHLFTKFKRKVLTCLQTKAIVNCNHNTFKRWVKKHFHVQPATRCCVKIITNWNAINLFRRSTP